MDNVTLEGKTYVTSKVAAKECGYTQDYVGQLSRGGHIDARRVGSQWYVFLDSLKDYKTKAETFKPEPPKYQPDPNAEATLRLEGAEYVSAALAAKMTDYNQDYVGQLARAGKIPAKHVANRWYVEKAALLQHKAEKDAMLRAVQAESVGLKKPEPTVASIKEASGRAINNEQEPLHYKAEDKPLFPEIDENKERTIEVPDPATAEEAVEPRENKLAIHIVQTPEPRRALMQQEVSAQTGGSHRKARASFAMPQLIPVALSITVVIAVVGVLTLKKDAIYASLTGSASEQNVASVGKASAGAALIDAVFSKELYYARN